MKRLNTNIQLDIYIYWYFIIIIIILLSRASPVAYEGSQARSPNGATAASNAGFELSATPTKWGQGLKMQPNVS